MLTNYEEDFTEEAKQNARVPAISMVIDISKQRYNRYFSDYDGDASIGISRMDYMSWNSNSPALGTSAAAYVIATRSANQNMPVIDDVD